MRRSLPNTIADALIQDYLQNGHLVEGDRLPIVKELQARYNTSYSTILNALGILESQGLVEKRHGSGCYVTHNAESGPRMMPGMIGLITAGSHQIEILRPLCRGVEASCKKRGYQLVIANSSSYEDERQVLDQVVNMGCRAAVIYPHTRTRGQLAGDYLKTEHKDFPVILVDQAYPEQERSFVTFDNYRAGYDMTKILLQNGHKRIAFMDIDQSPHDGYLHRSIRERHRGYLDALRDAGVSPTEEDIWLLDSFSHELIENITQVLAQFLAKWRKRQERPTAVIALEDWIAAQLVCVARELGIKMMDELEVVGFDNLTVGQTISPRFTTTNPDFARAGEIAVELAFAEMTRKPTVSFAHILDVPVLQRVSNVVSDQILASINDIEPASEEAGVSSEEVGSAD